MSSQISDLVRKLHGKTKLGLVDWRITANSSDFQVSFSDFSVKITNLGNNGVVGEPDFAISIINNLGNTIEEEYDSDLDADNAEPIHYHLMREIFELARRKALGSDQAISFILKEIDGLK